MEGGTRAAIILDTDIGIEICDKKSEKDEALQKLAREFAHKKINRMT